VFTLLIEGFMLRYKRYITILQPLTVMKQLCYWLMKRCSYILMLFLVFCYYKVCIFVLTRVMIY